MRAYQVVRSFFKKNCKEGESLLLGYSGGGDSKALLYLLLSLKEEFSFDLHLAHLNHGWREESKMEAAELLREAKRLKIPFHLKRLQSVDIGSKKNVESFYREERFRFFKTLYQQHKFSALLLAHHLDDLAETVLKRIFEGANLINLNGMQAISMFENMVIWRPLLPLKKSELLSYLKEKKLPFIQDKTNEDERFLRGRMRKSILPLLAKKFGKEISCNLALLSERIIDLKEYLDRKTNKDFKKIQESFIDFSALTLDDFEKRHLLYRILKKEKISLSRVQVEELFLDIRSLKIKKSINRSIYVDNGKLLILKKKNIKECKSLIIKKISKKKLVL